MTNTKERVREKIVKIIGYVILILGFITGGFILGTSGKSGILSSLFLICFSLLILGLITIKEKNK